MKKAQSFAVVPLSFLTLTLLVIFITFLVPTPAHTVSAAAAHWRAAAGTAPALLLIGSAITYLKGLGNFKAGRAAFRWLAFGMLALSLLFIQVAIWGLFDMWDTAWASSGTGLLPLLLTTLFIYISARKFARLLNIGSSLNNLGLVIATTLAVGAAMGVFAHYYVKYHIDDTDLYIGICASGAGFLSFAAALMHKVSRRIGASYQQAMRWLMIGLAALSISTWHEAINTLWFNNGSTYTDYGYYLIPWTITGLLLLYASYRFRMITLFVRNDDTPEAAVADVTDKDYIDSIIAVAGLASQPEAVDPILDDLRGITATMQPGVPLNAGQKQRLLTIYRQLETYLAQNDPLRTVTHDEVLNRVTPPFRQLVEHS